MTHDCDAAAVAITYNGALSEADEAEALAFIRSAVDTQHAKAGGSFELRVQWILEPKPRTLRDEVRAVVPAFADLLAAIEPTTEPATPPSTPTKRPGNYPTGPRLTHGATQSQIRDWARTQGLDVNPRGTVRRDIADAYAAAHLETP